MHKQGLGGCLRTGRATPGRGPCSRRTAQQPSGVPPEQSGPEPEPRPGGSAPCSRLASPRVRGRRLASADQGKVEASLGPFRPRLCTAATQEDRGRKVRGQGRQGPQRARVREVRVQGRQKSERSGVRRAERRSQGGQSLGRAGVRGQRTEVMKGRGHRGQGSERSGKSESREGEGKAAPGRLLEPQSPLPALKLGSDWAKSRVGHSPSRGSAEHVHAFSQWTHRAAWWGQAPCPAWSQRGQPGPLGPRR